MKESMLFSVRLTVWKLVHSEPATSYHQFKARKILSINSHLSAGFPFLHPSRPFLHFHPLTTSSPHLQCLGTWLEAANRIVWTNIVKPFILLSLYFYLLICEFIEFLYLSFLAGRLRGDYMLKCCIKLHLKNVNYNTTD